MAESRGRSLASGSVPAGQVAEMLGGRVEGEASVQVSGIAPVFQADVTELGFLADRRYLRYLAETSAGALLVSEALAKEAEGHPSRIVVEDPHRVLPQLLAHFYPVTAPKPGIHSTAILGKGVELGEGVTIGPYAVLEDGVILGDGVRIGAHSVLGAGSIVGENSVHAGVRLGVDGFGYAPGEKGIQKVPQVGGCVVEDDVEIGANCCIDRGSIGRTVIGSFTKLDNLVHIAHNVQLGKGVLLAGQTGIAGSVTIGDGVMTGGQAAIAGHVEVGDGVRIGGQAGVIGDIPPGKSVLGFPAREQREFLKATGRLYKLSETTKRLKGIEERLAALER